MRYQQGTQRIEIIVRKEGGAGETGNNEIASNEAGSQNTRGGAWQKLTGSAKVQRQRRVLITNATHMVAVSKRVLEQTIQYKIAGYGMRYGDDSLQEQVERHMEVVTDVSGFASAVTMGAVFGAWGGPLGMAVGAVLGGVSSGVSTGLKYLGRERELNYKQFKENNSIEYRRARANINMTTGRLR